MRIVPATMEDIDALEHLLYEVHDVHATARPDLFKKGEKKYSREELIELIAKRPSEVYVYRLAGKVVAHAFVRYELPTRSSLHSVKTLFVDDICVDSQYQHRGIASEIMEDMETIARENDCQRMLLNVYSFNEAAMGLYKYCGMSPLCVQMEKLL